MATDTKIEWTRGADGSPGKTWNPLIGCDRVSPGCDRCYAMGVARIREFNPNPKIRDAFAGTTLNEGNGVDWTGKVNLLADRLTEPLGWKKPAKVFVNSMSDLFHKDVPTEFIAKIFAVMAATPRHTYQILTKRHARMRSVLASERFATLLEREFLDLTVNQRPDLARAAWSYPLPNVHLGVSVETQQWADIRIPALLETPAVVRFLSCEPLLGPVNLSAWTTPKQPVNWVIVGGESGPGARPMHPDWARSLRDQCAAADVPFLFKQNGAWIPAPSNYGPDVPARARAGTQLVFSGDGDVDGQIMLHVGKGRAGRLLDGIEHNAFPEMTR